MNDKTEYQYPQTEHSESALSINDTQIAEARSAVEALAFAQGARNPETYTDPQAVELLAIGQQIETMRPRPEYKSDYRLAA
jgi:hypothetical protein